MVSLVVLMNRENVTLSSQTSQRRQRTSYAFHSVVISPIINAISKRPLMKCTERCTRSEIRAARSADTLTRDRMYVGSMSMLAMNDYSNADWRQIYRKINRKILATEPPSGMVAEGDAASVRNTRRSVLHPSSVRFLRNEQKRNSLLSLAHRNEILFYLRKYWYAPEYTPLSNRP